MLESASTRKPWLIEQSNYLAKQPAQIESIQDKDVAPVKDVIEPTKDIIVPHKDVAELNREVAGPIKDVTGPTKDVTEPIKDVTEPTKDVADKPSNTISWQEKILIYILRLDHFCNDLYCIFQ